MKLEFELKEDVKVSKASKFKRYILSRKGIPCGMLYMSEDYDKVIMNNAKIECETR